MVYIIICDFLIRLLIEPTSIIRNLTLPI